MPRLLLTDEHWSKIQEQGSIPVIPRKENSKIGNQDMDWSLYTYRHLVENTFARLKHFSTCIERARSAIDF